MVMGTAHPEAGLERLAAGDGNGVDVNDWSHKKVNGPRLTWLTDPRVLPASGPASVGQNAEEASADTPRASCPEAR